MSHDLTPERQEQLVRQQLDGLRAERFVHQLNIARWEAIPEALQDGSEPEAIEQATHGIGVLEAQIDALTALLPQKNRKQRRAEGQRGGPRPRPPRAASDS